MKKNYPNFYNGVARPAWAGPVVVRTERFCQERSRSDTRLDPRRGIQLGGQLGYRPLWVSGVVLTCSSRGRQHNIAVQLRSLRYTADDVGHIMALSSGGPETDEQYVPQPDTLNRSSDFSGMGKPSSSLSWRELEYYAQYQCQRGFDAKAAVPPSDENVTLTRDWEENGKGKRPTITVNEEVLLFPDVKVYENGARQGVPDFKIKWDVTVEYSSTTALGYPRGNDPVLFIVTLSYATRAKPGDWVEFCRNRLSNRRRPVKDLLLVERKGQILKNRIAAVKLKRHYALAHPRRSLGR